MASFTDKNPPKFNPYIQQLPVEEMYKVGMHKQSLYDQGVQKIQTQIDNVAGMEIARDVDKTYLQSKLNELGNNLKTVAAGDFSNFQLVNSVTGMTNKIAKDKYVLNAVSSTQKYKKGLALKDKLTSEGKNGISNDWMFATKANEWLSSNDIEKGFNTEYTPYQDYIKKSQDIVKNLAKDSTTNDVAFDYDKNGNIIGVRDAMTRVKIEGITPQKIQLALKAGLTDADWQQIQMDGLYKYSNVPDEAIFNNVTMSFEKIKQSQQLQKSEIENILKSIEAPSEKAKYAQMLIDLEDDVTQSEIEYNKTLESFQNGDMDSTKAKLYMNDWISNFSNSFSSLNKSETYETNPWKTIQMEEAKMNQARRFHEETLDFKYAELEYKKTKDIEDKSKSKNRFDFGNITLPTDSKEYSNKEVISLVESEIELKNQNAEKLKSDFLIMYPNETPESLDNLLKSYSSNGLKETDVIKRQKLENLYKVAQEAKLMKIALHNDRETARALYPSKSSEALPEDLKDRKINITTQEGTVSYNYAQAAEKFLNFQKYKTGFNESTIDPTGMSASYVSPYDDKAAREDFKNGKLSEADFKLYEIWKDKNSSISKNVERAKSAISKQYTIDSEQRRKYIVDRLKKRQAVPTPIVYSLDVDSSDKNVFESFKSRLSQLAAYHGGEDGGEKLIAGFTGDASDILSISQNLTNVNVANYGDRRTMIVTGKDKDGKSTQLKIPIDDNLHAELFNNQFQESKGESDFEYYHKLMLSTPPKLVSRVNEKGEPFFQSINRPYYTTANDGEFETSFKNATILPGDFRNVNLYTVVGNFVSETEDSERVDLYIAVKDPRNPKKPLPNIILKRGVPSRDVTSELSRVTDAVIYQRLYNRTWSNEEQYDIIEAAKKIKN